MFTFCYCVLRLDILKTPIAEPSLLLLQNQSFSFFLFCCQSPVVKHHMRNL
nr:MAG TPA: hypothetical protein [Caudoviricetes sp.]